MSKIGIFMADGCEEIEGLTVVDLLRRASIEVEMISIGDSKMVKGSHGIKFEADKLKTEVDMNSFDGVVLPGGMPGTKNLEKNEFVQETLKKFNNENKLIAAICAAPSVLAGLGLLKGKKATSYPGFDVKMQESVYLENHVVVDGNIITSRGVGTAIEFALEITKYFTDEQTTINLAESIVFQTT